MVTSALTGEEPTFVAQAAGSDIEQFVLRLVVEPDDRSPQCVGSAVWISGHLVLTAKHCVREAVNCLDSKSVDKRNATVSGAIRLYQVLPGPNYAIWEVRNAWLQDQTDLALLHVSLHDWSGDTRPVSDRGLVLRGSPPQIGERVASHGFRAGSINVSQNSDGGTHYDLDDVSQASSGLVNNVFQTRRDGALLSFPCFEIGCRFDSGMSGGPVFGEDGALVGIVAVGSEDEHGPTNRSYASTLWPLFAFHITANVEGGPPISQPYPVWKLVEDGVLHLRDQGAVQRRLTSPGGEIDGPIGH